MELKEITNKHIGANGSKTTIILVGNGSKELERTSEERLGKNQVYRLIDGRWKPGFKGNAAGAAYGLSARDHNLFNAHNHLEDGMEMVGYGGGTIIQQEYNYYYFDASIRRFKGIVCSDFNRLMIYARRKKAEKKPTNTININGYNVREPVREPLENGDEFYCANANVNGAPIKFIWSGGGFDVTSLKNGLIHLSKKAVKKHNKALRSFTVLK